ncbi:MAG: hypothetical protein VX130_02445 [Verrucomicrobiota bacterium]|nr:hypothetical protein [Verrucomicrobiota bacterium]
MSTPNEYGTVLCFATPIYRQVFMSLHQLMFQERGSYFLEQARTGSDETRCG